MQAGKLRHRLRLEHRVAGSPARTPSGAPNTAWTELCTVWGSLEALSGRRLETAQATWPKVNHEARIRYCAEVEAAAKAGPVRIVFRGDFYPVEVVLNWSLRNVELRLMCSQGAAVG